MTTTVTTTNPVRSDLGEAREPSAGSTAPRGWAFAGTGTGAAVAGVTTIALSSGIDVVYRPEFQGTIRDPCEAACRGTGRGDHQGPRGGVRPGLSDTLLTGVAGHPFD